MSVIIKKMETDEEVRGKAYVAWRSWQDTYPGMVSQAYLDCTTLEMCEETAFKWRDGFFVAKDGDRVVGFVGYGTWRDDPELVGEVYALYVLKEYHGTGVGRRLMDAALEELRAYPQVSLWVLKANSRAIRFNEKCGFVATGEEQYLERLEATEIRMVRMR